MKTLLFLFNIITFTCLGQELDNITAHSSLKLGVDAFTAIGFIKTNIANNIQPISNASNADDFIYYLVDNNLIKERKIKEFLANNVEYKDKKKAIVFLQHPLEISKLNKTNSNDGTNYTNICETIMNQKAYQISLRENLANSVKPQAKNAHLKPDRIKNIQFLLNSINLLEAEINENTRKLEKERSNYLNERKEFTSLKETQHFVLTKDKSDQFSSYLYDVNEVLLVILGGEKDLVNLTVDIENRATLFETSLNDLGQLAGAVAIGAKDAPNDCELPKPNDEIKVTFVLLDKTKIKAPSTVTLKHEVLKEDIKLEIHEKSYASFRVGISAASIDKKHFTLNNNELTITPSDEEKEEWKGKLMVMLELTPWGRDYDRLEPIGFKPGKDIGNFSLQRLGIVGGVKLAKDPLETLFLGFSYALSNSLALNAGLAYTSTPKDVTNLPVGQNASLDYLRENADREYVSKFFFGISLTPSGMMKTLGLKKD